MNKRRIFNVLVAFSFLVAGLYACNSSQNGNETTKPDSVGSTAEVLVVLQNPQQWSSPIGTVIKKYFQAPIYGLPQPEPLFRLLHVDLGSFSYIFKTQRNILMVKIDPKAKPDIKIVKDVWAVPQLVFYVTAPSEQDFADVFKDHHDFFIQEFMKSERQRILNFFRSSLDPKAMQKVQNSFGFTLNIPAGFYVAKTDPGFMWIRHETAKSSQGIMIISEPYTDTAQFSRESILTRIQKYQKKYIPGPSQGSYMSLDRKYIIPRYSHITNFPTKYAAKITGLWRVEHDFMGGPFISYTFFDSKSNQIVTLFGYVYYPNHKKRDLLMQVESLLYSINLSPQQHPVKTVKKH